MSKCTEIREICGDYAFDVEYSEDNKFTMFFDSLRNAQTVKRCIEVDDSVPNVATAVDFVEVVRCKDCKYWGGATYGYICNAWSGINTKNYTKPTEFCSYGERKEQTPTADVVEVRHGEWIHEPPYIAPNGKYLKASECSNCHAVFVSNGNEPYSDHPYCCECGAKMDGERKEQG